MRGLEIVLDRLQRIILAHAIEDRLRTRFYPVADKVQPGFLRLGQQLSLHPAMTAELAVYLYFSRHVRFQDPVTEILELRHVGVDEQVAEPEGPIAFLESSEHLLDDVLRGAPAAALPEYVVRAECTSCHASPAAEDGDVAVSPVFLQGEAVEIRIGQGVQIPYRLALRARLQRSFHVHPETRYLFDIIPSLDRLHELEQALLPFADHEAAMIHVPEKVIHLPGARHTPLAPEHDHPPGVRRPDEPCHLAAELVSRLVNREADDARLGIDDLPAPALYMVPEESFLIELIFKPVRPCRIPQVMIRLGEGCIGIDIEIVEDHVVPVILEIGAQVCDTQRRRVHRPSRALNQ